jgi:hypothetical protein
MTNLSSTADNARDQVRMLKDLSEGLRQAIGGATQLSHALRAPQFIMIRQALELTQEAIMEVTKFKTRIETPKVVV